MGEQASERIHLNSLYGSLLFRLKLMDAMGSTSCSCLLGGGALWRQRHEKKKSVLILLPLHPSLLLQF